MIRRPPDIASLRAAVWSLRAARAARLQISLNRLPPLELPTVPRLPASAERGVHGVIRRRSDTCLVRAAVLQRWHAAHGRRADLVIGVTAPEPEFRAHAWLEGDAPCHQGEYSELLRVPCP